MQLLQSPTPTYTHTHSPGTDPLLYPAVLWPPRCALSRRGTASFPSASQKSATSCHGATSVYVSHVKEHRPRRGNARRCIGDPTLTHGEVRVQWRAESLGTHVEDNRSHSADKHTNVHTDAPPYRHSAIRALSVCHLISSGHVATPGGSCYWKMHSFLKTAFLLQQLV